jgi:hypothetical protein
MGNKLGLKKMFTVAHTDQPPEKRKMKIDFEGLAKQFTEMKFSVW